MIQRILRVSACGLLLASPALPLQDWPQWRGPDGNGVASPQSVPLEWDRETNVRWRTPLAQPGNGSPVVRGGRVFLTIPEDEEGLGRSLLCFSTEDGRLLWKRTVAFDRAMPTHGTNPHCSTTPAADGERVVVWHASAGLHAYDHDGELLWSRDLGEFRHPWGHGTSPVLHDGRVLLHTGPGETSFVAAFDLASGETVWRVEEPEHRTAEQLEQKRLSGSWCTPLVERVGGRDLVLCAHPSRVVAYDAATGEEVFWCAGLVSDRGDLTYSSPVVADGTWVVQGGYVGPSFGVRLDGEGDVTQTHRVWHRPDVMSNCASGVFAGGAVFLPDMGGFVYCIDPSDGSVRWKSRVGRGGTWGSIVLADGRLYLMDQNGTTSVFAPNADALELLARNPLGEATNSTPAIAGGEVFLRTHEALYCISDAE